MCLSQFDSTSLPFLYSFVVYYIRRIRNIFNNAYKVNRLSESEIIDLLAFRCFGSKSLTISSFHSQISLYFISYGYWFTTQLAQVAKSYSYYHQLNFFFGPIVCFRS
jgi:hypothetical protein